MTHPPRSCESNLDRPTRCPPVVFSFLLISLMPTAACQYLAINVQRGPIAGVMSVVAIGSAVAIIGGYVKAAFATHARFSHIANSTERRLRFFAANAVAFGVAFGLHYAIVMLSSCFREAPQ